MLGTAVATVWVYDPAGTYSFPERPDRVEVDGGHWHYEYGDGMTMAVYHANAVYPACEKPTLDVQNHIGDD